MKFPAFDFRANRARQEIEAQHEAAEAALADPHDPRRALDLAKLLVLQQRYAQADDLLMSLPPEARDQPEIRNLCAHVSLLRIAQEAPAAETLEKTVADDPADLEARFRLSAVKMLQDDYEGAMEQLLEIVRHDRNFRDQAGRHCLLAIFAILGENDERVLRYRSLLQKAMH